MINDVQKNFSNVFCYINDFCMMQVIGVLLGVNIQIVQFGVEFEGDDGYFEEVMFLLEICMEEWLWSVLLIQFVFVVFFEKVLELELELVDVNDDEKELKNWKVQVLQEKEVGNVEYKKKNFEVVVQYYIKVFELYGEDIFFIINWVVVYLEMGKVCVLSFDVFFRDR